MRSFAAVLAVLLPGVLPAAQRPAPPVAPDHADLAYAPASPAGSEGHLLDLYLPDSPDPAPVVLWSGGSAWRAENGRRTAGWVAEKLVPRGYAVAGVSIRSSDNATFPAQVHDVKAAIRWLRRHADDYGLDPGRVAVMGDSSGGWTAAMAGLTGDVPELEGEVGEREASSAVQAAVAFYPPSDFLQMDAHAIGGCVDGVGQQAGAFCHDGADSPESRLVGCPIQSCPEEVRRADPARHVSAADPPILILHGGSDPLVPFHQGELLYEALSDACHDATFVALPAARHGPFTAFLTEDAVRAGATRRRTRSAGCRRDDPEEFVPTWETVIGFLDRTLGGPEGPPRRGEDWRARALALLEERVPEPERRRHAVGVEAILHALARRSGGEPETWGLAGLLHDVDRGETDADPTRHGVVGARLVAGLGFAPAVARAIASHDDQAGVPRERPLDHALHCADQTYWAILASGVPLSAAGGPEPTPAAVRAGLERSGRPERLGEALSRECESLGLAMDDVLRLSLSALRAEATAQD